MTLAQVTRELLSAPVCLPALSPYRFNSRLCVSLSLFFYSLLLPLSSPAVFKTFTVSVLSWRRS